MDKKKTLSPEERALFAEAVKNVKPLTGNRRFVKEPILKKPRVIAAPAVSRQEIIDPYPLINLDDLGPEDWVEIEEQISFHHPGLQNKLLKKLAQGKISIEAKLDLHRLNMSQALVEAKHFILNCQRRGYRLGLIIHGKGKQSTKPILKNALNIWLRTQANVLAFHTAQPKDGGAGAVYVLIKFNNLLHDQRD